MSVERERRPNRPADESLSRICERSLDWAEKQNYAGWDPYDGLNSPLLSAVCRNWFTRLVGMHVVHKAPTNLRPALRVPKERNTKGIALFALAHLNRYRRTDDRSHLERADTLLDWLARNQSPGYDGAWGYNFDWQNGRQFFLPAHQPSIVVSVFCGRAFLDHYRCTEDERSRSIVEDTVSFIRSCINTDYVDGRRVYTYTPRDSFVVINANALAAKFFARVADITGDRELLQHARELVDFVVDAQVDSGAWYYAMPATDSHLSHDNFHTGFVLESLAGYLAVDSRSSVERAYERGFAFFETELFESDGAPRFEHDSPYPRDAHAAGQAIRTFALDGTDDRVAMAKRVADWAVEHLFDESGYFYRRRGRLLSDETPYIRWSQAWMCYGLSTYLRAG
jgi:hypothetical protein